MSGLLWAPVSRLELDKHLGSTHCDCNIIRAHPMGRSAWVAWAAFRRSLASSLCWPHLASQLSAQRRRWRTEMQWVWRVSDCHSKCINVNYHVIHEYGNWFKLIQNRCWCIEMYWCRFCRQWAHISIYTVERRPCLGTPQYFVSNISGATVVISAWQGIVEVKVAWQNRKAQGVHHVRHQRRRRRPHGSDQRTLARVSANWAVGTCWIMNHVTTCYYFPWISWVRVRPVSLICLKCWELRKGSWVKILRPESYWFQTRGQVVPLGSFWNKGAMVRWYDLFEDVEGCSFSFILNWTSMLVYVYAGRAERNIATLLYSFIFDLWIFHKCWMLKFTPKTKPTSQERESEGGGQISRHCEVWSSELLDARADVIQELYRDPFIPWNVPVWMCIMQSWDINLENYKFNHGSTNIHQQHFKKKASAFDADDSFFWIRARA